MGKELNAMNVSPVPVIVFTGSFRHATKEKNLELCDRKAVTRADSSFPEFRTEIRGITSTHEDSQRVLSSTTDYFSGLLASLFYPFSFLKNVITPAGNNEHDGRSG